MSEKPLLEVRSVSKRYEAQVRKGGQTTLALDDATFSVSKGEFVGIMGPSGSGKSTLLNCISTIDSPTSGTIVIGGRNTTHLKGKDLATFRREELGFVFQDSNLLDTLTVFENIALSLTIRRIPSAEIENRVHAVAQQLSIEDTLGKYPYQVSGGQKQRAAAARATIGHPKLILADEPTGALDSKSAAQLLSSFELLNRLGATIAMVTHDQVTASYCSRIIFLKDGRTWGEITRDGMSRHTFFDTIMAASAEIGEGDPRVC